jgi:NAD(P)-dependent dehydrogenase (short-subunit alcohol dehydrogenase family)
MDRQVVVITGASAGVGRATARAFGQRRAQVGLLARGRDGLEAAKREIEISGGEGFVFPLDVANPEQVEAAAQAVEENLGPIDVWINNAMTSVFSPVKEMNAEELKRVTEVTYLGHVYGTLSALRRMLRRDRAGRFRAGLSRYSAASRLLRCQACDSRFYGFAALRAAARSQQCSCHDGADARAQYAAVFLGEKPITQQAATCAALLSAGSCR